MAVHTKVIIGVLVLAILVGLGWWYEQASVATPSEIPETTSNAAFAEKDLVGNWIDTVNSEEMDFRSESGKNSLNSYVDKRPEYIDCPWTLKEALVSINCPTIKDSFKIISLALNEKLVIERDGTQFNFISGPRI